TPLWESPVLIQPSGIGGTNWSPMPYSPDTGYFYVPGTVRTSAFVRNGTQYTNGQRYTGGGQTAPIGSTMSGTFTAIDAKTNKIAWQHKTPYRIGGGGGSTVTAGGGGLGGAPGRQFPCARCQDRAGTVPLPDRIWRGRSAGGLRGGWRAVHRDRDRRQSV